MWSFSDAAKNRTSLPQARTSPSTSLAGCRGPFTGWCRIAGTFRWPCGCVRATACGAASMQAWEWSGSGMASDAANFPLPAREVQRAGVRNNYGHPTSRAPPATPTPRAPGGRAARSSRASGRDAFAPCPRPSPASPRFPCPPTAPRAARRFPVPSAKAGRTARNRRPLRGQGVGSPEIHPALRRSQAGPQWIALQGHGPSPAPPGNITLPVRTPDCLRKGRV